MLIVLGLFAAPAAAIRADEPEDLWTAATEAVQFRRYEEAIPLLQVLLDRDPSDVRSARLLGAAYEMAGRPGEALRFLENSVDDPRFSARARGRLAFDLAALMARQEQPENAVAFYNTSLDHDAALVPVYLNRANLQVELGEYRAAVQDYERFLALRPSTDQREEIIAMIALLTRTIEAEEERRAEEERIRREEEEARRIAEEERRRAEEERLAREEQERQEAEERRRKMMDSVMESLGAARDDARSFDAEFEDILEFDDELDILD